MIRKGTTFEKYFTTNCFSNELSVSMILDLQKSKTFPSVQLKCKKQHSLLFIQMVKNKSSRIAKSLYLAISLDIILTFDQSVLQLGQHNGMSMNESHDHHHPRFSLMQQMRGWWWWLGGHWLQTFGSFLPTNCIQATRDIFLLTFLFALPTPATWLLRNLFLKYKT